MEGVTVCLSVSPKNPYLKLQPCLSPSPCSFPTITLKLSCALPAYLLLSDPAPYRNVSSIREEILSLSLCLSFFLGGGVMAECPVPS